MYKKMIYFISFVLVSSLAVSSIANADEPNLVGWWKFDETSGTTAYNSAGYSNPGWTAGTLDGVLNGNPQWVTGYRDGAILLDPGEGTNDYVSFPSSNFGDLISELPECTLSIWVYWNGGAGWQRFIDIGSSTVNYIYIVPQTGSTDAAMRMAIKTTAGPWDEFNSSAGALPTDGWHHVAATVSRANHTMILYLDGNVVGSKTNLNTNNSIDQLGKTTNNWLGRSAYAADPYFNGYLDDFKIYNCVLTLPEIKRAANPEKASMPIPDDGSITDQTDVTLQWDAGTYAAGMNGHHVYFGDIFSDVNQGTGGTDKGLVSSPSHPLTGLVEGQTYYWRIDEVNGVNIWRGDVWSFTVQPLTAYNPSPPDDAEYVDVNDNLIWSSGSKAVSHDVYLGTDETKVTDADRDNQMGVLVKQDHDSNSYEPGTLAFGTTYYWRIDEVNDPCIWTGDVWSFETNPFIPKIDPNLRGWWKFDDGDGTVAIDSSGYYNHGTLYGPNWVAGYDGNALQFDGTNDYVSLPIGTVISSLTSSTITTWVNFSGEGGAWQRIFNFGTSTSNYAYLSPLSDTDPMWVAIITEEGQTDLAASTGTLPTGWHHVAAIFETGNLQLYLDGENAGSIESLYVLSDLGVTTTNWLGRAQWPNDPYFNGSLDDFRIYNKALTQDEIKLSMRANPFIAWAPQPANGSTPDIRHAKPLSWSKGEMASKHDVYFGTDATAVEDANTSDTSGIYRGRKDPNTYTPPEALERNQTYSWRIDEYNTDTTISKGDLWEFTIADYLVVDDFEYYNPSLADTWKTSTKATASLTTNPVNTGSQAMAVDYNNNTPSPYYSEAYADTTGPNSLGFGTDWTSEGVKALGLWFLGALNLDGSLTINGGIYTIEADGWDIWGTADGFHYAYKTMAGPATITAKVESVENTDPWAKAGVMIRDTLEPGSKNVMIAMTPGNGVTMQFRDITDGESASVSDANFDAPHWVKLTFDEESPGSGNYGFTAEHSSTGNEGDWTQLGDFVEVADLHPSIYIGLCVTSHTEGDMCTGEFSNVSTTGAVSGDWQSQDIGIQSNDPEPIYVVLEDSNSNAIIYHDDPNATLTDTWTEWRIDLNDFAGVSRNDVKRIYIGVGTRGNTTTAGGTGTLYIDDIRLHRPGFYLPEMPPWKPDLMRDGVIDYGDVGVIADNWLISGDYNVTPVTINPLTDDDLVAYYQFEGDFDDSSTNGYHGEPNGATTVADPCRGGQVASFDGEDDYVALPIGSAINTLTSSTFMSWVDFEGGDGTWVRIFDFGSDTNVYMFLSPRIEGDGIMRFAITISSNAGEEIVDAPETLASGWHHVAVTIDADNDTIRLYLDGLIVGTITNAELTPSDLDETTNNWLGRSQWEADGYFMGSLDDFQIYSRALSHGEVAYLAGLTEEFTQPLYLLLTPANPDINMYNDSTIDFKDIAELGKSWGDEQVWPTW